ncbi:hypothetical protein SAMN05216503_0228 [Polaribacter sp. KT25b]|uniref:hypothetical protein n=1 Tax=Polaribacter sp. KT25b TaxID=1855336 RepID=UPI00087A9448|nr:hypothetical protein [Polaribacter sp. KT25b]SDR67005.1 hypothetical protein SAMN05216503_0228 [Polaribacter sp. KT25b]
MDKKLNSNGIYHIKPNFHEPSEDSVNEFSGIPIPTTEASEWLNPEKLQIIHEKLNHKILNSNNESYELHGIQGFIDFNTDAVFRVLNHSVHDMLSRRGGKGDVEFDVPQALKDNNYEKLKDINHYIIVFQGIYNKKLIRYRNMTSEEFFKKNRLS